MKYCYGCGVEIQHEFIDKVGYVPPTIVDENVLCQRCFQLTHYGKPVKALINIDQDKIFDDIKKDDGFIVLVIDIINFSYSMISEITVQLKGRPVLLVANKFDLLPESVNEEKIKHWISSNCRELGINVIETFLTSASTHYSIKALMETIMERRNGKNVYLIGAANVGKSSIVNSLLKNYSNTTTHYISVSRYPGTTLAKIEIPLDESTYLYDTPGFINPRSMTIWLEPTLLKHTEVIARLKPRIYQLSSPQTLHFGSLARLDYHNDDKISLVAYFSDRVEIHRGKLVKGKDTLIGKVKPVSANVKSIDQMVDIGMSVLVNDKIDIKITGFGTITVVGKGTFNFTVWVPAGVDVGTMETMI